MRHLFSQQYPKELIGLVCLLRVSTKTNTFLQIDKIDVVYAMSFSIMKSVYYFELQSFIYGIINRISLVV